MTAALPHSGDATPSIIGLRRSVSRGAAAALVLRAGGMALAGVAGIVLARSLGAAGYGTYSWAYSLAVAVAVPAALGADQLLVREAGIALDSDRWDGLRGLVRSALSRVALGSLVLIGVAAGVVALAGAGLGDRRSALLVALAILPLAAVAAVAQGALLGLGRTAAAVAPGTVMRQGIFVALAILAVAIGGLTSAGAVALQLTATALATVAVLVLLRRALASGPGAGPAVVTGRWMRTSVPMGAAAMLLAINTQVGLLVIGAIGRSADAGVYAAALLCMAPFTLLLTAGRLPLGGVVARLRAAGERRRLQRGLRTATRAVAAVSAVLAAVLLVAPGTVLSLFGEDFRAGAGALRILAVLQLTNSLFGFNGLVLIMGGQERAAMRAALGCLVLNVALCLALVPTMGESGAALAALVAVVVRNVSNSITAWRRLGLDTTILGLEAGSRRSEDFS